MTTMIAGAVALLRQSRLARKQKSSRLDKGRFPEVLLTNRGWEPFEPSNLNDIEQCGRAFRDG